MKERRPAARRPGRADDERRSVCVSEGYAKTAKCELSTLPVSFILHVFILNPAVNGQLSAFIKLHAHDSNVELRIKVDVELFDNEGKGSTITK